MDKRGLTGAPLSREQSTLIGNAVQAFHTISRLTSMCIQQIAHRQTDDDGDALLLSIRDVARMHGEALDSVLGNDRLGVFDPTDEVGNG